MTPPTGCPATGGVFSTTCSTMPAHSSSAPRDGDRREQRVSWWAALALLRCVSSSPAAALQALKTKLHVPEGESEKERLDALDRTGSEMVLDESDDDSLSLSETTPAGDLEEQMRDAEVLNNLIGRVPLNYVCSWNYL